jgi:hypothetical protein
MIKKFLYIFFTFFGFCLSSQNFNLVYNFANVTATTGTLDPTPTPIFTNLACGTFMAFGTSSNPNASQRFSFTNWGTGASTLIGSVDSYTSYTGSIDTSKYYQVSLMPANGYTLNLNSISFSMRRSGTGVRNYAIRSSLSSYANNLPASVGTNTKLSVIAPDIFFWNFDATSTASDQKGSMITLPQSHSNISGLVNFRFYAWNAEGTTGTFSIDSVVFIGTVTNTITVPSGILKLSQDLLSTINIFPNPSKFGVLNVISEDKFDAFEVTDNAGHILLEQKMINAENTSTINISDFDKGIYYVKLKNLDGQEAIKKFIVSD